MTRPADSAIPWTVTDSRVLAAGAVTSFVEDIVDVPGGAQMTRQYLGHYGAVGVIAVDADDRVACVRQYRHPVGATLVELPAGLLDVPGEEPLLAAQRELAEEAELAATTWQTLLDVALSPGGSMEVIRIYLATGLTPTSRPEGFVAEHEESLMDVVWFSVEDLMEGIVAGDLSSPSLVAGISALVAARATRTPLRPADAPWPLRDGLVDRIARVLPAKD